MRPEIAKAYLIEQVAERERTLIKLLVEYARFHRSLDFRLRRDGELCRAATDDVLDAHGNMHSLVQQMVQCLDPEIAEAFDDYLRGMAALVEAPN